MRKTPLQEKTLSSWILSEAIYALSDLQILRHRINAKVYPFLKSEGRILAL